MSKILEILKAVLSIFIGGYEKFIGKIGDKIPEDMLPVLYDIIRVVDWLKTITDNPLLEVVVSVTPFNQDDRALEIAKNYLPKVLEALRLAGQLAESKSARGRELRNIGSMLTEELTNMPTSQSVVTYEAAYKKYRKQELK